MLSRGSVQCQIFRNSPPVSDGAGGWYSPEENAAVERCTVKAASYTEREQAGREGARITHSIAFRARADIQRGDVLAIRDLPRLTVIALPDDRIPYRTTKTAWCEQEEDQHGNA